uniref:hypothetical protein n=2 Tax=Lactobacillaceae TaxID=33958 RepID=UPI0024B99AE7
NGYDREGYDRAGFDKSHHDRDGYAWTEMPRIIPFSYYYVTTINSSNEYPPEYINGYDRYGYNPYGYDKDGYDRYGYTYAGFHHSDKFYN